jgi:hypothetical protein
VNDAAAPAARARLSAESRPIWALRDFVATAMTVLGAHVGFFVAVVR